MQAAKARFIAATARNKNFEVIHNDKWPTEFRQGLVSGLKGAPPFFGSYAQHIRAGILCCGEERSRASSLGGENSA